MLTRNMNKNSIQPSEIRLPRFVTQGKTPQKTFHPMTLKGFLFQFFSKKWVRKKKTRCPLRMTAMNIFKAALSELGATKNTSITTPIGTCDGLVM